MQAAAFLTPSTGAASGVLPTGAPAAPGTSSPASGEAASTPAEFAQALAAAISGGASGPQPVATEQATASPLISDGSAVLGGEPTDPASTSSPSGKHAVNGRLKRHQQQLGLGLLIIGEVTPELPAPVVQASATQAVSLTGAQEPLGGAPVVGADEAPSCEPPTINTGPETQPTVQDEPKPTTDRPPPVDFRSNGAWAERKSSADGHKSSVDGHNVKSTPGSPSAFQRAEGAGLGLQLGLQRPNPSSGPEALDGDPGAATLDGAKLPLSNGAPEAAPPARKPHASSAQTMSRGDNTPAAPAAPAAGDPLAAQQLTPKGPRTAETVLATLLARTAEQPASPSAPAPSAGEAAVRALEVSATSVVAFSAERVEARPADHAGVPAKTAETTSQSVAQEAAPANASSPVAQSAQSKPDSGAEGRPEHHEAVSLETAVVDAEPEAIFEPLAAETAEPTHPASETRTAAPARGAPETVANLAAQIARKLDGRSTRFEVALDPHGMGAVQVSVEIGANGELTAHMAFEKSESAAELRGRAAELQRALEQAGFDLSRGGLSFGEGGRREQAADENAGRRAQTRAFQDALLSAEAADAPPAHPLRLRDYARAGLDVRI